MKKPHVSLFIIILISLCSGASAGAEKVHRIALEELQLTTVDKKGVVEDLRLSEAEAKGIIENIKAGALKSFGLDNIKAIVEKGLIAEFDETVNSRLKVERIIPPLLRFYGKDGNINKEMPMRRPENSKYIAQEKGGDIGTPVKKDSPISRDATVSADGKSAIVTEYFAGALGKGNEKYVSATSSKIQLYNVSGDMLWEEVAPEHMYVNKMAISDKSEVIAFILIHEQGGMDRGFSANRLIVFSREKERLLDFTGRESSYSVRSTLLAMSGNGRYLSIAAAKKGGGRTTLFFDIKGDTLVEWQEVLLPLHLSDDGIVFTIDSSGHKVKLLDFSKQTGSPD